MLLLQFPHNPAVNWKLPAFSDPPPLPGSSDSCHFLTVNRVPALELSLTLPRTKTIALNEQAMAQRGEVNLPKVTEQAGGEAKM